MNADCYTEIEKFIKGIIKVEELSICDIGSRDVNGSFRKCFPSTYSYLGVDIVPGENVDLVLSDPHRWIELDGKQFDIVISGSTIEHVKDIYRWFEEFGKILKVGGDFFIAGPVTHHIHNHPIDCWRFLPDGLRFLIEEKAGLKLNQCYCLGREKRERFYETIIAIGTKL